MRRIGLFAIEETSVLGSVFSTAERTGRINMSLLVIGATGNIGRLLVRELERRQMSLRALVRDPDHAHELATSPLVDFIQGDLRVPASIDAALEGIDRVFLLSPPMPDQVTLQGNVIEAIERTRRSIRVVTVSVLGAVPPDVPLQLARWNAVTEAQLRSTGLPCTILRPQFLMQNLLRVAPSIQSDNLLCGAFGAARLSLVDGRDLARVAATVLASSEHDGRVYTLTGPQSLSFTEVAATFSAVLGRPIRYADVPVEAYHEQLVGNGIPHWAADDLTALSRAFRRGYTGTVTTDVTQVTGHPARPLSAFLRDHASSFQGTPISPRSHRRSLPCVIPFGMDDRDGGAVLGSGETGGMSKVVTGVSGRGRRNEDLNRNGAVQCAPEGSLFGSPICEIAESCFLRPPAQ